MSFTCRCPGGNHGGGKCWTEEKARLLVLAAATREDAHEIANQLRAIANTAQEALGQRPEYSGRIYFSEIQDPTDWVAAAFGSPIPKLTGNVDGTPLQRQEEAGNARVMSTPTRVCSARLPLHPVTLNADETKCWRCSADVP